MEKAKVFFNADGIEERYVEYVHYELNQLTDPEGQPTGVTRGGKITLKTKGLENGKTDILEWMCDSFKSKNGTITFRNSEGGVRRKLEFTKGFLVEYAETYMIDSTQLPCEEFTISAKEIRIDHAVHNNRWTVK